MAGAGRGRARPRGELSGATARALGLAPADVLPARGQGEPQDEVQYHAWTDGGG